VHRAGLAPRAPTRASWAVAGAWSLFSGFLLALACLVHSHQARCFSSLSGSPPLSLSLYPSLHKHGIPAGCMPAAETHRGMRGRCRRLDASSARLAVAPCTTDGLPHGRPASPSSLYFFVPAFLPPRQVDGRPSCSLYAPQLLLPVGRRLTRPVGVLPPEVLGCGSAPAGAQRSLGAAGRQALGRAATSNVPPDGSPCRHACIRGPLIARSIVGGNMQGPQPACPPPTPPLGLPPTSQLDCRLILLTTMCIPHACGSLI